MSAHNSELTIPLDAIVFDCDGTLSHIEGIDELAISNGVGQQVIKLTSDAMGKTGLSPELYQQRLGLVLPTEQQIQALGQKYFDQRTPDILSVIRTLQSLGKAVYVVSAGLYPAVVHFAKLLDVAPKNVFAVDIYFDATGKYRDFDRQSPLIYGDGKRTIVQQLKKQHKHIAFVGDGLNDYAVYDLVTRFVGYGGAYYREQIQKLCHFYITANSMMPLLDLCLTADEMVKL